MAEVVCGVGTGRSVGEGHRSRTLLRGRIARCRQLQGMLLLRKPRGATETLGATVPSPRFAQNTKPARTWGIRLDGANRLYSRSPAGGASILPRRGLRCGRRSGRLQVRVQRKKRNKKHKKKTYRRQ